jgi:hypothetical protein
MRQCERSERHVNKIKVENLGKSSLGLILHDVMDVTF